MTRPFVIHARHPGGSAGRFTITVREVYAEGYGVDFQCVLITRSPVETGLDKLRRDVYTEGSSQRCASDHEAEGVSNVAVVFILIVLVALAFGWIQENM